MLENKITKKGEVKSPAATCEIGKKAKHPKYINMAITIKAVLLKTSLKFLGKIINQFLYIENNTSNGIAIKLRIR